MKKLTDLEIKKKLDLRSSSFCGAKWYNATVWLGSGMTTSCHHPPAHKVDIETVKKNPRALHNTPEKKEDRRKMQIGERPAGCEYCWKIEDMGTDYISDRVYKSKIYSDESLNTAHSLDYTKDVNLKTLEIAFDRTCNFACSYCNPAFSTTWVKDLKKHGAYENLISDGRNHFTHTHDSAQLYRDSEENPYIEAFFRWWESDLHKTLDELRVTGGEPLMSPGLWRLFDWFKRDGLVWDQYLRNMRRVIEQGNLSALHMMCTVNALCLESLTDYLDLMLEYKSEFGSDFPVFTLNIVRFPSFQSPLVLPADKKREHSNNLKTWLSNNSSNPLLHEMERNQVRRLIDYLIEVEKPHSETDFEMSKLHNDFKQFYSQYDVRRNKDFVAAFPGLADWYNSL